MRQNRSRSIVKKLRTSSVRNCFLQMVSWEDIEGNGRKIVATTRRWLVSSSRVDKFPWGLHTLCVLPGTCTAL